ncbi:hypothetical protein [Quadrisphaera setariae]|uniref:Uncharacterized protein n=1 Tax=Quadrisphaera setariae TaxID=2593304 RepID=A0A5C8ZES6_9ACTN|nr:hypothetical protein [Quadrisphaera setariae]TXR55789.1 hypothetical protein FMM08_13300 [Quadrisphaera setariae]
MRGAARGPVLRSLTPLLHEPRRTRLQVALAVVVVLAAAMLVAGWDAALVATVSAALLGAGLVAVALPRAEEHRWPAEPPASEPGSRSDLLGLAVAFTARQGGMGQAGLVRVQALGRSRLRRRGVDLDDPAGRAAAEELLGAAAVRVLLSRSSPTPGVRAVAHCLARLEALGPGPAGPPPAAGPAAGTAAPAPDAGPGRAGGGGA